MAHTYRIYDQEGLYFVTFTVHQWVDVFTRKAYADILLDSIRYCQAHKGLRVYAWVLMSNHCHLIVDAEKGKLSDIIRDLKKHTAKEMVAAIENNAQESRKRWLLWLLKKDGHVWFWEEGYHGEEIRTKAFFDSKVEYIHSNPVRAGIVEKEEEYLYSSCGDFYGTRKGLLELAVF
jgi:putative transposase